MSESRFHISQIGLVARSHEGHAAKGMQIKGHEDLWVDIQANTFRNWVNENLKSVDMSVANLANDFCDGIKLCALVQVLQKRTLKPGWIRKPTNQHQFLENVSTALNAIAEDGVKLVNIGKHARFRIFFLIRASTYTSTYTSIYSYNGVRIEKYSQSCFRFFLIFGLALTTSN